MSEMSEMSEWNHKLGGGKTNFFFLAEYKLTYVWYDKTLKEGRKRGGSHNKKSSPIPYINIFFCRVRGFIKSKIKNKKIKNE